jgi:hypothetical protein
VQIEGLQDCCFTKTTESMPLRLTKLHIHGLPCVKSCGPLCLSPASPPSERIVPALQLDWKGFDLWVDVCVFLTKLSKTRPPQPQNLDSFALVGHKLGVRAHIMNHLDFAHALLASSFYSPSIGCGMGSFSKQQLLE